MACSLPSPPSPLMYLMQCPRPRRAEEIFNSALQTVKHCIDEELNKPRNADVAGDLEDGKQTSLDVLISDLPYTRQRLVRMCKTVMEETYQKIRQIARECKGAEHNVIQGSMRWCLAAESSDSDTAPAADAAPKKTPKTAEAEGLVTESLAGECERMLHVAIGGLEDMAQSLKQVYTYNGSKGTFNRAAGSKSSTDAFSCGALRKLKAHSQEGGMPRRLLMSFASCIELLDQCTDQYTAKRTLSLSGVLTALLPACRL